MSRAPLLEPLEARSLLAAVLSAVGSQPVGALTGKIVYASAGHGLTANASGVWSAQRGETNDIVEDFGNYDQMSLYADHLWRAGATVVPTRPVGHQTREVIVDNTAATFTGTWTDGASAPYFSLNAGAGVRYRTATSAATETAVARFTPDLPVAGLYPVYAWALDGSNRAADQLYRVNHAGGSTEVKVNHARVGKGWVYLGTYSFRAGGSGSVEVSNRSGGPAGRATVADAVRFGNGVGDVVRNGLTSGAAREDEASLYWIESQAGWLSPGTREASSNWRSSGSTDGNANVGAPSRWARYMNAAPFGQSLYLSFHSNATGGAATARGGSGLFNDDALFPGTATPNQEALATLMGEGLRTDMISLTGLEFPWSNNVGQTTFARSDFAFGEIRGDTTGYEFDATILEVAFHDNVTDAALLADPVVRSRAAQSSTQSTVRYFNQFGGGPLAFAAEVPSNLRTSVDRDGNVTLAWNAPTALAKFGGAATGYRVYASRDGQAFDGGAATPNTTYTLTRAQVGSGVAYFKVVAVNAGGESAATAVVAARGGDARAGRVLIVNGFDRLGRAQSPRQSIAISGTNSNGPQATVLDIARVRPRDSNSFDYAVRHAQAIANHPADIGFDTTDNAAIIAGQIDLSGYRAVVWISGEESTLDRTFAAAEQSAVTAYLNGGGKLFVSGSEIGWDLQARGNGAGFFNNALRANYVGDDASTYAASGVAGGLFSGLSISFDNGTSGTYDVEFPDRLAAINGSVAALSYNGGTGGTAATYWQGTNGARSIVLGFPFETIVDAATRASMMRRALDAFGFNSILPAAPPPPLPIGIVMTPPSARSTALGSRKPSLSVAADVLTI